MTQEEFKTNSLGIPQEPGIYKYYDGANTIIYVGKAKNLRKRVSSYFNKTLTNYKTHELVKRIQRIEFTVVDSEQDAFFLENQLIKQYQPRFNIDLKDDKSFPYIVIKNEPFPRVFLTRKKIQDGSEYLGPFTSVARVREILILFKQHIQLRTCKLALTEKNIQSKKFKLCLEYHLGNCKGPCIGLQDADDYKKGLQNLKQVLKGKVSDVQQYYKNQIQQLIQDLAFEKAALIKKKLDHLETYSSRSIIVSQQVGAVDVFYLIIEDNTAFVNYLMVRNGAIIQTHNVQLRPQLEEQPPEVLSFAIAHIRNNFNSDAPEIVIPFEIEYAETNVKQTIAKVGDKKKLLDLSEKNVKIFMAEVIRKKMLHTEVKTAEYWLEVLADIQQMLQLQYLPVHIECFDNSNFQGSYPVAAMVCFKNGQPCKEEYRHYNIKTVEGINDFASMNEVVLRRYKRLLESKLPLPQLVIIDGGKGQLSAAMSAIKTLGLEGKMTLIGLAKSEEAIFFSGDSVPIMLPWNSKALHLIRSIRNEVHRFGITFHRKKRSKGTFKNELELIQGIGKATATTLLKKFKSVKGVKIADYTALSECIGGKKAELVITYFQQKTE